MKCAGLVAHFMHGVLHFRFLFSWGRNRVFDNRFPELENGSQVQYRLTSRQSETWREEGLALTSLAASSIG